MLNDQHITHLEQILTQIILLEDEITLPQYRKLKAIRHNLADFLVRVVTAQNKMPGKAPNERTRQDDP